MRWYRALQRQRLPAISRSADSGIIPLPHFMGEVPAGRRGTGSVEVPVHVPLKQVASIDYDVVERLRPVPLRPYRATSPIGWGRALTSPNFRRTALLLAGGEGA